MRNKAPATSYQRSTKDPDLAKVRRTGKTETRAERMAFYDKAFNELFLRHLHPLPVGETPAGVADG